MAQIYSLLLKDAVSLLLYIVQVEMWSWDRYLSVLRVQQDW